MLTVCFVNLFVMLDRMTYQSTFTHWIKTFTFHVSQNRVNVLFVITVHNSTEFPIHSDDDSMIVHPLKWRPATVNRMFDKMSRQTNEKKTSQAKRQMKPRTIGEPSKRQAPYTSDDYPKWAFQTVS